MAPSPNRSSVQESCLMKLLLRVFNSILLSSTLESNPGIKPFPMSVSSENILGYAARRNITKYDIHDPKNGQEHFSYTSGWRICTCRFILPGKTGRPLLLGQRVSKSPRMQCITNGHTWSFPCGASVMALLLDIYWRSRSHCTDCHPAFRLENTV
jgi:hypothetical protein